MRLSGTLPAWLGWLALALLSLVGRCSGGADSDDDDDSPAPLHQPEAGTAAGESVHQKHCWIFTHMNKSGGQTIKGLLSPWIEKNNLSLGLYDSHEWKNGTETAREFLENKYTVTWGAYTEGLRPHGVRPHCKWFTVFRHPVSRLVSAYYFCHKRRKDPLCATGVLRAEEADLLTFARHWTNFGLRQFAIAFILPESVIKSRAGQLCPDCPGWFLLKSYLDETRRGPGGLADADIGMREMLAPVQNLLVSKYAAVGILEEYNTTLHLFTEALNMPGFDWVSTFDDRGMVNKDRLFMHEIGQAVEKVMTDVKIKKYLQLDLLLYEHAVAVHKKQLKVYGLA